MTEFVCRVKEENPDYLSACNHLPKYPGTQYCILHFPGEEKKEDFEQLKKDKLEREDYDFSGTVFPEGTSDFSRFVFDRNADFTGATFVGEADFQGTQFSGKRTSFRGAQFSGERTLFLRAQFSGGRTSFSGAQFSGGRILFYGAQFGDEETDFGGAQFVSAETSFQEATFAKEVYFSGVTFSEKVTFWGNQGNRVFGPGAWAQFDRPRIEKPELLTFNTVLLHPGWFINADVRKVDFTDVEWYGLPGGPEGTIEAEVKALAKRGVESPYTLLSQASRRLSANAEENREYPLANEFYYWSMNALRKEGWSRLGLIGTLYWALSGYGVRAGRALGVLVTIAVVFAVIYMTVGHPSLRVLPIVGIWQVLAGAGRAMMYSLGVMARLRPEPIPEAMGLCQILVTIEGILGPLQIALLALAIRRKVMR